APALPATRHRSWRACPGRDPWPVGTRTRPRPITTGRPNMLRAEGISTGYRTRGPVITNVSLHLPADTTVGQLATSGGGKSTLARVLALLHTPVHGVVSVDGEPVRRWRFRAPKSLRTRVGIVFQQPRTAVDPRLSMWDVIAEPLRAARNHREITSRVLELAALTAVTDEMFKTRGTE